MRGADEFHGVGGRCRSRTAAPAASCARRGSTQREAAGSAENPDFNGAAQDGVGWYQTTCREGMRCSAAVAYLHPALGRPNLEVMTHFNTTRVVLDGGRATGIEGIRLDELMRFTAEREVIVVRRRLLVAGRPDPFGDRARRRADGAADRARCTSCPASA